MDPGYVNRPKFDSMASRHQNLGHGDDIYVERLHQIVEVCCRQFDSGARGRRNILPDESLLWNRFRIMHDCGGSC
ncbi:hypothetical protein BJS_00847 [Bradyrhizobium japonicum SEMIA 5079]|nr:hypothetical protein BJS_00847 [Bradyrhizobium japonicum SEMIA 5079]